MYVSGPAWILFSLVGFGRAIAPDLRRARPGGGRAARAAAGHAGGLGALGAAGATMMLVVRAQARRRRPGAARAATAARLWRRLARGALDPGRAAVLVRPGADHGGRAEHVRARACWPGGRSAGRRSCAIPRSLAWREAWRGLWPQTLLGLSWASPSGGWRPSRRGCGRCCSAGRCCSRCRSPWSPPGPGWAGCWRGSGICAVPEEIEPPPVVVAAGHAVGRPVPPVGGGGRPSPPRCRRRRRSTEPTAQPG